MAKGNITVHTENIFPIIKKWLYSDKDIFLRELVSNACDAITKMKKVDPTLEDAFEVCVVLDKKAKTITVSDNGIGMTASEIEKYITQVAFSGAEEFLERYQKEGEKAEIIGHFGLGFYSAFMVSDSVDINTKSYMAGAEPAFWTCDGGIEYDLSAGSRTQRGTDITLHITKEDKHLLDAFEIKAILQKYCAFLPVPVYFYEAGGEKGEMLNETQPLWLKKPKDCNDEEYKAFYRKVFADFNEPLFWIHLNVDFPFHLKGILYFPKLGHELEAREGEVKLYNNQVFVADNIKEVIPEYLLLLKGVIDCPDLPLNVSRSFLQNDRQVQKISDHIVKKVSDKLTSLFKNHRDDYEKYWDDINPFIKYGCMKDEKFYEKVKGALLYKTAEGSYVTLDEYLDESYPDRAKDAPEEAEKEAGAGENKEAQKPLDVYYTSSEVAQSQYLSMYQEQGLKVLVMPLFLDNHFIQFIEMKHPEARFSRIDAQTPEAMRGDGAQNGEDAKKIVELFQKALPGVTVETQSLKSAEVPAMILVGEQARRMKDMQRVYGGDLGISFPDDKKLVLNTTSPLVSKVCEMENQEAAQTVCQQVYDLARLANEPLSPEEMTAFIARSEKVLEMLSGK